MKLSDFWVNMEHEFGASYARILARDLVLGACGNLTVLEALERGYRVKEVWEAVCDVQDVPEERRLGPDLEPGLSVGR